MHRYLIHNYTLVLLCNYWIKFKVSHPSLCYLSIYLSFYHPIYLYIYLSHPSRFYLFIYLSIYLFIYISIYYLSIRLFIHLISTHLICLSTYLSVFLSEYYLGWSVPLGYRDITLADTHVLLLVVVPLSPYSSPHSC